MQRMVASLRRLGYWSTGPDSDLPDPAGRVDESWDEYEREVVGAYLAHGTLARPYLGPSRCRICGQDNGSTELTDGVYLWPEGLAHYVREHAVRLPVEFVSHAVARLEALEDAEVDDEWWRRAARA